MASSWKAYLSHSIHCTRGFLLRSRRVCTCCWIRIGGRGRGRGNGQSGCPRKQGQRKDFRYPIDKTESYFDILLKMNRIKLPPSDYIQPGDDKLDRFCRYCRKQQAIRVMVRGTVLTFRTLQAFRDNTLVFEDEYESSPHQTKIETKIILPLSTWCRTWEVMMWFLMYLCLCRLTSLPLDPLIHLFLFVLLGRLTLVLFEFIPRSPFSIWLCPLPWITYLYVFALLSETDVVRTWAVLARASSNRGARR